MTGFEVDIIYRLEEIFGISIIVARLKDENVTIRKCAAISLGYLYDPLAIEPLIEARKDKDKDVRVAVIESVSFLYYLDKPRVVESLIKALNDEDKDVRVAVVEALGDLDDPRAIEPLIEALKDKDEAFRMLIDDALNVITWESFDGNQKKWKEWWEKNKEKFIKKK